MFQMENESRVIGTCANKLICIGETDLDHSNRSLPVGSSIIFEFKDEYLKGIILFAGGNMEFISHYFYDINPLMCHQPRPNVSPKL